LITPLAEPSKFIIKAQRLKLVESLYIVTKYKEDKAFSIQASKQSCQATALFVTPQIRKLEGTPNLSPKSQNI